MFEEFSSGYYLGRLYVEPYAGDHAVLDSDFHRYVTDELYLDASDADATGETAGADDADTTAVDGDLDVASTPADEYRLPLVMKLGNTHFRVRGEGAVPADTLAVPREWLEDEPRRDERSRVLLAKREHAERLFDLGAV